MHTFKSFFVSFEITGEKRFVFQDCANKPCKLVTCSPKLLPSFKTTLLQGSSGGGGKFYRIQKCNSVYIVITLTTNCD